MSGIGARIWKGAGRERGFASRSGSRAIAASLSSVSEPHLSSTDFVSSYQSLQVSARKRYSHNLVFLASYTYAKSLDDGSSWVGVDSGGGAEPEDPTRLYLDKGRSAFDIRHRFTLSGAYEIPFRSTHHLLNAWFARLAILRYSDGPNGISFWRYGPERCSERVHRSQPRKSGWRPFFERPDAQNVVQ